MQWFSLVLPILISSAPSPSPNANGSAIPETSEQDPVHTDLIDPYGFLRLEMAYNTAPLNSNYTPAYVKPINSTQSPASLHIHPRLSRLGFRTQSSRSDGPMPASIRARVELDFHNGGYSESRQAMRLRHGVATLSIGSFDILFGQTWHTVSQLLPVGATNTLMWMAGNTGDRAPQLRLRQNIDLQSAGVFSISLSTHLQNAVDRGNHDDDSILDGPQASSPGFQGRFAWSLEVGLGSPIRIAVAGHYGNQAYSTEDTEVSVSSEGLFAEVSVPLFQGIWIQGEAFAGSNLSDIRGGIGQGINTNGEAIDTHGYWVELVSNPTAWLKASAGLGRDDPNDDALDAGQRSLNTGLWAGIQVKPWDNIRVGFEWLHYTTEYSGLSTAKAHQLVSHLTYYF